LARMKTQNIVHGAKCRIMKIVNLMNAFVVEKCREDRFLLKLVKWIISLDIFSTANLLFSTSIANIIFKK
jgi:hypothetical protein